MQYLPILLLSALVMLGCTKKKLEIEVVEIECKDLKLSNVRHELITPCLEGNNIKPTTYSAKIHIDHNNKAACLDYIFVEATFKNENGSTATGTLVKNRFKLSDPEVNFTSSTLSILLTWQISTTHMLTFNTAEFSIHSENEIANKSNVIYNTIPTNCKSSFVNSEGNNIEYELVGKLDVNNSSTTIKFYDFGSEDNDIIDVYVNEKLVLKDLKILNDGENFTIALQNGKNTMVVIAKNEGSVPPNTCGVGINNQVFNLTTSLKTGQALELNL